MFTFANMLSRSSSALSSQKVASRVSSWRVGGVVISKKRVNNVRNEQTGSFSCGSQLFVNPVSNTHAHAQFYQNNEIMNDRLLKHYHLLCDSL